jgi:hypothetical protein
MAAGQSGRRQALKIEPLLERLRRQIDWYDRKAKVNQRAYKASKISIIVLAILIPVLAEYGFVPGFEDSGGFLVGRCRRRDRAAGRAPGAEQMPEELDPLSRHLRGIDATSSICSPRGPVPCRSQARDGA